MEKDVKTGLKYCCKRGILVPQEMKDGEALASPGMRQAAAVQISLHYSIRASLKFPVQDLLPYTNTDHSAKMMAQHSV